MIRLAGIGVLGMVVAFAVCADSAAAAKQPTVRADGNGRKCSLSGKKEQKSFYMAGSGWKPGTTVQLVIVQPDYSPADGKTYTPLANQGQYKVDARGNWRATKVWTCWPTKQLNYPDKTGTYILMAYQVGDHHVNAITTFEIVK